MKKAWQRFAASRRATLGLNLLIIFGAPVLLHWLAGMNRFGDDGSGWYWAYGVVALVGVILLVSGVRSVNVSDRR